jgi:hypothetical protein
MLSNAAATARMIVVVMDLDYRTFTVSRTVVALADGIN